MVPWSIGVDVRAVISLRRVHGGVRVRGCVWWWSGVGRTFAPAARPSVLLPSPYDTQMIRDTGVSVIDVVIAGKGCGSAYANHDRNDHSVPGCTFFAIEGSGFNSFTDIINVLQP